MAVGPGAPLGPRRVRGRGQRDDDAEGDHRKKIEIIAIARRMATIEASITADTLGNSASDMVESPRCMHTIASARSGK